MSQSRPSEKSVGWSFGKTPFVKQLWGRVGHDWRTSDSQLVVSFDFHLMRACMQQIWHRICRMKQMRHWNCCMHQMRQMCQMRQMIAANGLSHPRIEMEQRWQVFTLVGAAQNKVPVLCMGRTDRPSRATSLTQYSSCLNEGKGKYCTTAKLIHNWQTECTTEGKGKQRTSVICTISTYVRGLGKINYSLQSGYIVGTYIISDCVERQSQD